MEYSLGKRNVLQTGLTDPYWTTSTYGQVLVGIGLGEGINA